MPDLLRRLDQRVVPMLASALRRAAGGRHRRGVLAAVGMTLAVAVVLAAVLSAREALPGRGHAAGTPLRVGVSDGDSIPAYVAGARERLAGVDRPTLALVSLAAYLGPDRLGPLLENARPSRVYLRVPLPGISTEVIAVDVRQLPGDVVAGMDAAAVRKEEEVAIATRLAGRLTGDSPRSGSCGRSTRPGPPRRGWRPRRTGSIVPASTPRWSGQARPPSQSCPGGPGCARWTRPRGSTGWSRRCSGRRSPSSTRSPPTRPTCRCPRRRPRPRVPRSPGPRRRPPRRPGRCRSGPPHPPRVRFAHPAPRRSVR